MDSFLVSLGLKTEKVEFIKLLNERAEIKKTSASIF